MDAAIVKLDPLPNAVRATTKDDNLIAVRRLCLTFRRSKDRRFIGRIHIRRLRLELRRAGIYPLEHGAHAQLVTGLAHLCLGNSACHGDNGVADQARTVTDRAFHARADMRRFQCEEGKPLVRKAHGFQAAHPFGILRDAIGLHLFLGCDDFGHAFKEPRIEFGILVHFGNRHAFAQSLRRDKQAVGRRTGQCGGHLILGGPLQRIDIIETRKPGFKAAQRLLHAFMDVAADGHDFANRFHRGRENRFRTLEFFKGETRYLGDDIIDRRFKTGGRCAGNIILDLVERITNRQLCCDLGNREAGGLGCERR